MVSVCFDFDGVLAEYSTWKGHEHIGKPIEETIELVKRLHENGVKLALCSTRLSSTPFIDEPTRYDKEVTEGDSLLILCDWLIEQGIRDCFKMIQGEKPMADYYIDDKALRYGQEKDYMGTLIGSDLYEILLKYRDQK